MLSISCAGPTARAESLSCSSVNGVTLCSKSGSTSCQSLNGKTVCCETVGNRSECHDMPATKPPWRSPPRDQDQDPEQGPPGDDDTPDSPPLLLDRSVDISATVLSLLLLGSSIHPVAQTVPPVLFDAKPSRMREIALTQTIRRNQRMLLLAGKLPVRRCVVHCGAVNSLDHWRRP
jgi:hypothetical protein